MVKVYVKGLLAEWQANTNRVALSVMSRRRGKGDREGSQTSTRLVFGTRDWMKNILMQDPVSTVHPVNFSATSKEKGISEKRWPKRI